MVTGINPAVRGSNSSPTSYGSAADQNKARAEINVTYQMINGALKGNAVPGGRGQEGSAFMSFVDTNLEAIKALPPEERKAIAEQLRKLGPILDKSGWYDNKGSAKDNAKRKLDGLAAEIEAGAASEQQAADGGLTDAAVKGAPFYSKLDAQQKTAVDGKLNDPEFLSLLGGKQTLEAVGGADEQSLPAGKANWLEVLNDLAEKTDKTAFDATLQQLLGQPKRTAATPDSSTPASSDIDVNNQPWFKALVSTINAEISRAPNNENQTLLTNVKGLPNDAAFKAFLSGRGKVGNLQPPEGKTWNDHLNSLSGNPDAILDVLRALYSSPDTTTPSNTGQTGGGSGSGGVVNPNPAASPGAQSPAETLIVDPSAPPMSPYTPPDPDSIPSTGSGFSTQPATK